MVVVIDATVGGEDSNSYLTLAEAEAYFATRMPAPTNWAAATPPSNDDKSKALITATRLLDQMVDWEGEAAGDDQALLWPRVDLLDAKGVDIEEDVIPNEVKYAVCEFAEILLATDRTADLGSAGLAGLTVGSINLQFSQSNPPARKVLPDVVWDYVKRWCSTRYDGGTGSAKLVRG